MPLSNCGNKQSFETDSKQGDILSYFIKPIKIQFENYTYSNSFSYTHANYLKPNIQSKIKSRHFEVALKLTSDYFHKANVIDIGCADGPFLPSLSHYFISTVGIDINQDFLKQAQTLANKQNLNNVSLMCSKDKDFSTIKRELGTKKYSIIFLMEVMEHVGNRWETMYQDKLAFLKDISKLIDNEGFIVMSVPKMVGISFAFQIVGQIIFNLDSKKDICNMSLSNLCKCILFCNTDNIEHQWVPYYTHIGFNHKKLETLIERDFIICKSKSDYFQQIYIIKKK